MASPTVCNMMTSSEESIDAVTYCGGPQQETGNNRFFRGVMIAIPAGLLLWAGLLRVVGEVLHHL